VQKEIYLHKVYATLWLCKVHDVFIGPPGIYVHKRLKQQNGNKKTLKVISTKP